MKISVIIPTYNEYKLLQECLDSLSKQSLTSFEVIVVDDGSTDKTHLLKDIKYSYPIKWLTQPHQGAGAARNLAAHSASGKILVFLDADMVTTPSYLEELTEPITDNKQLGTFTRNEYVGNYQNPWARCWNWEYLGQKTDRRLPLDHPDVSPVYRAILKSEFMKVGGYDEIGYGEDWTLSQKLGAQAQVVEGAKLYHHNPDSPSAVFRQAIWFATRPYKLGIIGRLVALLRASLPVSLAVAVVNSIRYQSLSYLPFKLVYDLGIFLGQLRFLVTRRYSQ